MEPDDSSNETDDSIIDIYSTKNVIRTYHAILEELKSNSSKNEINKEKHDNTEIKKTSKAHTRKSSSKKTFRQDSPEIIELNDSLSPPLTTDESRNVRRSARLRNRGKVNKFITSYSNDIETRTRNQGYKRRKEDSDKIVNEDGDKKKCTVNPLLDDDELNYEVTVKIIWKSVSVQTFRLRRFQKFTKIFEHFMKEENVPVEKLLFTLGNKKIFPNDTPDSVNLKVYEFIEGGVLSHSNSNPSKSILQSERTNEKDCIVVKIQDAEKKLFKFSINKKESFKSVMIKYAEQIEVPVDKIRFFFDGEILNSTETPASLDLENDEVIDVKLI